MSDYRRLISYIYAYRGNEKEKNVGYAKIEVRKEQCRIYVSVKGVSIGKRDTCVCLLAPDKEISLGRIHIRGGKGEFRAAVNVGNIMQSGIRMQDCYGLAIRETENEQEHLATIWEDAVAEEAEVTVMEIRTQEEPEVQEKVTETETEQKAEGQEYQAIEIIESPLQQEERTEFEEMIRPEPEYEEETQEEKQEESENGKSEVRRENPGDDYREIPAEEAGDSERVPSDTVWREMQRKYPKMTAFDYEKGCEILRIRPQDIGLLPMELWVYGSNSFLLHGYYSFRHLIFARLENPDGDPKYLLGVPGHYYRAEKNMAAMFGFSHFVLAKKQPEQDERFGYWYAYIRL